MTRYSTVVRPRDAPIRRAASTIEAAQSVDSTRPCGPTSSAAECPTPPGPAATSRTSWPTWTSALSSNQSVTARNRSSMRSALASHPGAAVDDSGLHSVMALRHPLGLVAAVDDRRPVVSVRGSTSSPHDRHPPHFGPYRAPHNPVHRPTRSAPARDGITCGSTRASGRRSAPDIALESGNWLDSWRLERPTSRGRPAWPSV